MNNHLYSLDYILLTLRLVIKHLDFNEEDIFRYGSVKDQPPLEALKDYITLILNKKKPEDSLPQFIFDFNNHPENIQKRLEISHNTLSKLSQEVMIHGCLLDKNNLKVLSAWTLLCNELYIPFTLLDKPATYSNTTQSKPKAFVTFLEKNGFKNIFNEFMNTLCALGYQQTVEAFHQFLYITHLVTLHNDKNQTTPAGIAKIQSICLTNGLELEGIISQIDPLVQDAHYSSALKKENMLFFEMVGYLANCSQFKNPFSITDYQPGLSEQFNTTFEKIIATIWAKPNIAIIPYSNDIFGTIPKSDRYVFPLPLISQQDDNESEQVRQDLSARSSTPRSLSPEKTEREKKSIGIFRRNVARSDEPLRTRKISSEGEPRSKDKQLEPLRARKVSTEGAPHAKDKEGKAEPKKGRTHLSLSSPRESKSLSPRNITLEPKTRKEFNPSSHRSAKQELQPRSFRPRNIESKQQIESKSKPVLPLLKLPNSEKKPQDKSAVLRSPNSSDKPKKSVSDIFSHTLPSTTSSSYTSSYTSSGSNSDDVDSNDASKHIFSLAEILDIPRATETDDFQELAKMLQDLTFNGITNSTSASESEEKDYMPLRRMHSKEEKRGQSTSPKHKPQQHTSEYKPLLLHHYTSPDPSPRSKKILNRHNSKSKLEPSLNVQGMPSK